MAKDYEILRIRPMVRPGEGEGVVNVYRHTIKTKGGTVLNVEVSEEDFTPEKVDAILTAKAQNADKILKL